MGSRGWREIVSLATAILSSTVFGWKRGIRWVLVTVNRVRHCQRIPSPWPHLTHCFLQSLLVSSPVAISSIPVYRGGRLATAVSSSWGVGWTGQKRVIATATAVLWATIAVYRVSQYLVHFLFRKNLPKWRPTDCGQQYCWSGTPVPSEIQKIHGRGEFGGCWLRSTAHVLLNGCVSLNRIYFNTCKR